MELIAIGFLLGVVVCFIIFIGGILYDRLVYRTDGRALSSSDDSIYRDRLRDSGDLEADRLDIPAQDREKGKGAKE